MQKYDTHDFPESGKDADGRVQVWVWFLGRNFGRENIKYAIILFRGRENGLFGFVCLLCVPGPVVSFLESWS